MSADPADWPQRTLTAVTVLVGLATVLSWFGRFHPWLEILTNIPHLLLCMGVVVFLVAAAGRYLFHSVAMVIVMLWFGALLVPYWRASPDPLPAGASVLTALQFNVHFENDDLERITELIAASDADVVALHEITTSQWEGIADRLSGYPYGLALPWDGSDPQLGGGMALLSRTPLRQIAIDPTASIEGRPILGAVTDIGGRELIVVGLHPHASRFESAKVNLRERQLDAVADLLRGRPEPAVILADLNMVPTSSSYRSFLNDLDWRDPHRLVGWDASWPSWGGALGLPIDHVLVSNGVALHDVSAIDGAGSDHRALIAEFSLR